MKTKYENNNKLSDFERFKLVSAFKDATEDAQKNNIHIQIDKLVSELMLSVIHRVQIKTKNTYIRPGFVRSLNNLFKF